MVGFGREQAIVFFGIFFGYGSYYFTRKSLPAVTPPILADPSAALTANQVGALGSGMALAYAAGKVVFGVVADRHSPQYVLALPLLVASVCNLLLPLTANFSVWFALWTLNGFVQGSGWGPCVRLLMKWWPPESRGAAYGLASTSQCFGAALCALVCSAVAQNYGWAAALQLAGIVGLAGTVVAFSCTGLEKASSQDGEVCGTGGGEAERGDGGSSSESKGEKAADLSVLELLGLVYADRRLWLLGFAFFCLYVVRSGISDWLSVYLVQSRMHTASFAGQCMATFEVGGAMGSFAAGLISDRVFQGRRGPVSAIFSSLLIILFPVLSMVGPRPLIIVVMFCFGVLLYGPQMLIGLQINELADSRARGTAQGACGMLAGLGSMVAGLPIGLVITSTSPEMAWTWVFSLLCAAAGITCLTLLPLWSAKARDKTD
eukprot:TRINITY_DN534_c0_g1_i2.p1 TRINITY_DN534_c0_g1~~TRINITY_DN534_c0_g1_i2.p1  ORF type:complete len:483 (-),score=39.43 TRINITY_DN534_c0_g1_i2:709-2004(-)